MALAAQLTSVYEHFSQAAPKPALDLIAGVTSDFQASYKPSSAIQVGDSLPEFRLSDAAGKEVSSADLLTQGPLLIAFYRGSWCPYCNIELAAFQKHLDDFKAKGVTLVAISPELPDTSLSTVEKNELKFPVLSDVGNKLAKQLGILFAQPEKMRPFFASHGLDFKTRNGDESLEVWFRLQRWGCLLLTD